MNILMSLRIALRALRVNLLRSLLTMLGIIIGVASVIAMIAVGAGARARVQEQIASLGTNLLIIWPGNVTLGAVRSGAGASATLTEDDAIALSQLPDVAAAAPQIRGTVQFVSGNTNWAAGVIGTTPEYFAVRQWEVTGGRTFSAEEAQSGAKVVLLGQTVANALFGDSDPVGQTIRVKRVPFEVIGVLARKGQNQWGQDQDDVSVAPLRTTRARVLGSSSQAKVRSVALINVKVREGVDLADAQEQIRRVLRERHRLPADREDDFGMRNLSEILETQEQSSRVLTYLLMAIASVSLLVGGIGIMNIMLVSVTERTREIGLRMAVGARSRDILAQFLIEAVTLSLLGAIAGIALGVAASYAVGTFAGWRTALQPESIVIAVGFAGVIGVFFGFYPARKASRLSPIDALRYE